MFHRVSIPKKKCNILLDTGIKGNKSANFQAKAATETPTGCHSREYCKIWGWSQNGKQGIAFNSTPINYL